MIWGLLGLAMIWGASAWEQLGLHFPQSVRELGGSAARSLDGAAWMGGVLRSFIGLMTPVLIVGAVLAVLANLVQTGPIFTFKPLKPKGERINPVAGFKRIYSMKMLFEAFKSLLKLGILGGVAVAFFFALWPQLPAAQSPDTGVVAELVRRQRDRPAVPPRAGAGAHRAAGPAVHAPQVRQGHDDEPARAQGGGQAPRGRSADPRQAARAAAREPQAVRIGEARAGSGRAHHQPEHLAIALKYQRGTMAAPVLLAKGADSWAAEMRALARRHGIPIYERKPLARQLFRAGQLGQVDSRRIPMSTSRASTRTSMPSSAASPNTRCAP